DPSHPATIYLAAGDRGLVKSGDGGRTWKVITAGTYVERVVVDPFDSSLLYISTGSEMQRSLDAGKHWHNSRSVVAGYVQVMVADPNSTGNIYAGNMEGRILISTD